MTPLCLLLLLLAVMPVPSDCGQDVSVENETMSAAEIIIKANENVTHLLTHVDIKPNVQRNAVPCTSTGCKWPKDGSFVVVPVAISPDFNDQERDTIIRGLVSFHQSTCVRFVWRSSQVDYIYFFPGSGCWSYLGRQGRAQLISLQKGGCVYMNAVQHEVLHALGFHHEHVRSDRDSYVDLYLDNVYPEYKYEFDKVQTNNLGTPYDYNSVLQLSNFAFSKNGNPTITAKRNANLVLGQSQQMTCIDIDRVNRLYQCCE